MCIFSAVLSTVINVSLELLSIFIVLHHKRNDCKRDGTVVPLLINKQHLKFSFSLHKILVHVGVP